MKVQQATRTTRGRLMAFSLSILLAFQLAQREISARYRGSFLGIGWSLLTPLIMLTIYTFVFGSVFKARWPDVIQTGSMIEFAIILFSGLIIHQLLSEVTSQAPGLVTANTTYVKKVVFPIHILSLVSVLCALFQFSVNMLVLVGFMLFEFRAVPESIIFLPVVLLPFVVLLLGLSWLFSALGVFFRDLGQLLGPIIMASMFLAPIFFPSSALPDWIRPGIRFNPITVPVEQVREILLYGRSPDWGLLGIYGLVATIVAILGFWFFQSVRNGFADVL